MSQLTFTQLVKKSRIHSDRQTPIAWKRKDRGRRKPHPRNFTSYPWKPREREFRHGPFWSSNCLGEFFQRERTLWKKASEIKRCSLSHDFGFLPLYFGVFAAISAFMNLVTASYWLWFDHLDPWKFDKGSALVSHVLLLLSVYGWHKRSQWASFSLEIHADSCWAHVLWVIVLSFTSLLPQVLNPTIPDVFFAIV